LNDKIFLDLARTISIKAGKLDVAAEYENSLNKLQAKTDNSSGVNNEYNSHNG
jgi:hypothetical protein